MNAPATEPRLASDQRDVVLALALGALAAGTRFEETVRRTSSSPEALEPDDPVVLASLGVIAFARTLKRWLDESAEAQPAAPPRPADGGSLSSRELLR